jgi:hypothetical protein
MSHSLSYFAVRVARRASRWGSRRVLPLIALAGFGLALAGCSKCDVPNLLPRQAGPQSCHDGPSPQS